MFENYRKPNKKIGILSDSHLATDLTKDAITKIVELGCEYVIHAGDICSLQNLKILKESGLKTIIVYGNNDSKLVQFGDEFNIKIEPHYFKIDDSTFKLMHLPFYFTSDCDILIYGHTHIFEAKKFGKTLYINPGEICGRETSKSEFVILRIEKNKFILERFYKKIGDIEYKIEKMEFER